MQWKDFSPLILVVLATNSIRITKKLQRYWHTVTLKSYLEEKTKNDGQNYFNKIQFSNCLLWEHPATFMSYVSSPHSHLTVHHTREVELGQQILHLVVLLAVLLYVSMVTRNVRAQHVPHQEGQAALLTITVFLQDTNNKLFLLFCTWKHTFKRLCDWCGREGGLTFNIRPFAPALKLPVKRWTFIEKQTQKLIRYSNRE